MKCNRCDHDNPDQASFCAACGKPLASSPAAPLPAGNPWWKRPNLPLLLTIACAVLLVAVGAMGYLLLRDDGSYDDEVISLGEDGEELPAGGAVAGRTGSTGGGTASPDKLPAVLAGTVVEANRRSIKIRAEHNDRVYTVAVGIRTKYSPRRRAAAGDRVAVDYHFRSGHMIGDRISYR